ncbi:MAG: type II toxin-antitoxin system VapC family toxin [Methylomonas sp.]
MLLIDTCIIYDWLMGELKDQSMVQRIQSEGAYVSAVSVWEMVIKNSLGKMPLPLIPIAESIESQGFQWLAISPYHAQTVLTLGQHHRDPFDRLLIAQSIYESFTIVTYDQVFRHYLDNCVIIAK